jgi:hypothetical protein
VIPLEIDKLVAEKVMGWEISSMTDGFVAVTEHEILTIGEHFTPSTKIEDAFLVVQKFDYHLLERDAGHYYCTVCNEKYIDGDGDTAPMAICLAALKAFGVEVE